MWIYYVFVLAIVAQGFTAPVTEEHHNRVKRQLLKYDMIIIIVFIEFFLLSILFL